MLFFITHILTHNIDLYYIMLSMYEYEFSIMGTLQTVAKLDDFTIF